MISNAAVQATKIVRPMRVRIFQLRGYRWAFKSVTSAAQGLDDVLTACAIELLAYAVDIHLDKVGLGAKVEVPDVLGDHRLGDDAAGVAHEIFEQGELLIGEVYVDAGAADLATGRIEP